MPSGIYKRIIKINIGKIPWNKGKKETRIDVINRQKESHKGKKPNNALEIWRKNGGLSFKGKHHTEETKQKISNKKRGKMIKENHPNWIKDRTKLQKYGETNKDRRSSAYNAWRLEVYRRDNYKCRIGNCNCSGRIIAHHILSFTDYPELRYNINNGITLCQKHHPRKRVEEQKLIPFFQNMVEVKEII